MAFSLVFLGSRKLFGFSKLLVGGYGGVKLRIIPNPILLQSFTNDYILGFTKPRSFRFPKRNLTLANFIATAQNCLANPDFVQTGVCLDRPCSAWSVDFSLPGLFLPCWSLVFRDVLAPVRAYLVVSEFLLIFD
jgi:hypothetical protein